MLDKSCNQHGQCLCQNEYSGKIIPVTRQFFPPKEYSKGAGGGGGGGGTKTKPHPKIQQTCSYTTEDRFKGLMQLRVERTAHQLLHSLRVLDSVRKDVTP